MHRAVETVGLLHVRLAQQNPPVGGELSGRARLPGVGERSARLREHAGQAVDHIRRIGVADIRLVVRVVVLVLSRHG